MKSVNDDFRVSPMGGFAILPCLQGLPANISLHPRPTEFLL